MVGVPTGGTLTLTVFGRLDNRFMVLDPDKSDGEFRRCSRTDPNRQCTHARRTLEDRRHDA